MIFIKYRTLFSSILRPVLVIEREPPFGTPLDLGGIFWVLVLFTGAGGFLLMVPLGAGAPQLVLGVVRTLLFRSERRGAEVGAMVDWKVVSWVYIFKSTLHCSRFQKLWWSCLALFPF